MRPKQFVVRPGDRSAALCVVGTSVTVRVSAEDSKGQQVTLQSGDAGSGSLDVPRVIQVAGEYGVKSHI